MILGSLWVAGLQVRTLLALRGQAPWRLTAFLDDAHRRGVLRLNGAEYQFRHALLHIRLTANALERFSMHTKDQKLRLILARIVLANNWADLGNLDIAEAEYRALLQALSKGYFNKIRAFNVRYNLAQVVWQRGDKDSALRDLWELLQEERRIRGYTRGTTLDTWCLFAELSAESGYPEFAAKELRMLIEDLNNAPKKVPERDFYYGKGAAPACNH